MNQCLRLAFGALLLTAVGGVAHAAPQSYPLICRGGGGTLGLNSEIGAGVFYFQKGSQPAGAGLAAGQCSWADRGIGANEPTCLKQTGVTGAGWVFPAQRGSSYLVSPQAPWLQSLVSASIFQTFQVYNPGNGDCFVVTRVGP